VFTCVWHTAGVRWARLFDDLSGQLEAAEQADRAAESAELRRLELSRVTLADRFAGAVGSTVTLSVQGVDPLTGVLTQVGRDWVLLQKAGTESLIAFSAIAAVTELPVAPGPPTAGVDRSLGLGFVLRGLARDRAPVSVVMRAGTTFTGTIDRVGADFLDLAEHAADRPRRADAVQRVCTLPFAALAVVRPA
jgi:hypothetical protein